MTIEILPATLHHIQELSRTMNDEDAEEADAMNIVPHRALWRGWKNSVIRYTGLVDGEVAACWGCRGSFMGQAAEVWLVTGRKAREISPHEFARIYRAEVRKMLEIYPLLYNFVDMQYIKAQRMLRLAGFQLEESVELTQFKRAFRRFYKEA